MRDVEEKIKKYRDTIANELMKNGIYPDDLSVKKRLEPIDTKLAMFQFVRESEGENFDIKKYNSDMMLIYEDLEILYRLVYEFCIEKYEKMKIYADLHLSELENLARQYSRKTDYEINSTSLGNTLFFQATGFNMERENSVARINLGPIRISPGSKIACSYQGNVSDENVIFNIGGNICTPYSYNRDYIKIPGEQKKTNHIFTRNSDINSETMVTMTIDGFMPVNENTYIVYAGKDQIKSTNSTGTESLIKKFNDASIYFPETGKISFYIYNGSFIKFSFSEKPISTNFSGYVIEDMDKCQKITIDHNKDFTLDFETDGTVYAEKRTGIINDEILYYPAGTSAETFLVEEYSRNEKIALDASVEIRNLQINQIPVIDMIAIKELEEKEGPK